MSTATKTKQGLGVKFAEQVIEEGKRPMSPDQIKAKYQLEFPFTIRRVVAGSGGRCEHSSWAKKVGALLTLTEIRKGGYEIADTRCRICRMVGLLKGDSARFVYVDGGVNK